MSYNPTGPDEGQPQDAQWGRVPQQTPQDGQNLNRQPSGAYGAPSGSGFAVQYQEPSRAAISMGFVIGSFTFLFIPIAGSFFSVILSVVAIVLGVGEKRAIKQGTRDPANRALANAGIIVGLLVFVISFLLSLLTLSLFRGADFA